ncbi:polymer-forming cytoskeletal protein [Prodigiosinella confusarubida]|uniref:Polymer-forming cytoskeletal protein n=1 Tax=Serratia sp. (strain ATCC 39006) TaxID=104623 RepID=A0A2I5T3V2_SERS3|nr:MULTISPECIES: polymer-forming cytoskeletal protein [Enterobacterales]AUG99235.1 polymer-forming cytoskeletal protein [Serratia sp. ATCC 39006]AUH03551.1 polymer-forming cytoskeletal protein [Serratia sp. ATCC 39006]
MRKYHFLWVIWVMWAGGVVFWLTDARLALSAMALRYGTLIGLSLILITLIAVLFGSKRSNHMFSFDKSKKSAETLQDTQAVNDAEKSVPVLPETALVVSPVRVKKDTFISQGIQLVGRVEGNCNITIEGNIEGDVQCEHVIKVELGGSVKGELRAEQIIVNGLVEGRLYASVINVLSAGNVRGEVYVDEFTIEKGGVFIGQSNLLTQDKEKSDLKKKVVNNALNDNDENNVTVLAKPVK